MSEIVKNLQLKDLSNNEWSNDQINQIRYVSYKTNSTYNEAITQLNNNSWNSNFIIREYEKNKIINIVIRQTNYSYDEALTKLNENNGDYEAVIKEYLNIEPEIKENNKTVNQTMFKEMRDFMDDVKNKYDNRKKMNQARTNAVQMLKNTIKKDD